ncbi:MAG: ABC transporter ATP-binding protein [Nitrospinota bacterium]
MIEAEGLTKYYGAVPAIRDVSFRVEEGEVLGFLGPNGAGKTTTMKILTGFMPPTSGRARVAGFSLEEEPLEVKRRIGYMPENIALYTDMTVREYLRFVSDVKGIERKDREAAIERVRGLCSLSPVMDRMIGNISRGFKQRTGLAQALLTDPSVLILDEPTIGLDPTQIIEIRELIKSLGGERTIILCSHILPEVSMTCGRVVIINEGRVVAQDTPENLTRHMEVSASVSLTVGGRAEEAEALLKEVPGVIAVRRTSEGEGEVHTFLVEAAKERELRPELASAICRSGLKLLELRPQYMSLEDVFMKLVTEEEARA